MFKVSINEKQFADAIEKEAKKAKNQKQTEAAQSVETEEKSKVIADGEKKPETREELDKRLSELDGLAREEYERGNGKYAFKYAVADDATDEQLGKKLPSRRTKNTKNL